MQVSLPREFSMLLLSKPTEEPNKEDTPNQIIKAYQSLNLKGSLTIQPMKPITNKNYVAATLELTEDIRSKEYRIFELLYQYVGAENIDIDPNSNEVH